MNAVIIDDEKYCTDVLCILLEKNCPEVHIDAVFNQSLDALSYLKLQQPDIIFLDIEMPHLNGFDLLEQLSDVKAGVIFTTAYDQYAAKAFRFNAIDYLLKPIDKDELVASLKKSIPILSPDKMRHLIYLNKNNTPEKILLPIGNEIVFVQVVDIICCEADGSYCKVYTVQNPKPYLISRNLLEIEDVLNNPAFFRPHTSWLIHETYIEKLIKGEGMQIVLKGDIHVPVARSKRQDVSNRLIG
ncbi:MAG: response regulator transcription factor [Bacteroidia bacterium]|jgi:two-component system LytT family response regulator|nr:MAG: response regulator transcription factor [Bacteroidia bacterium]